MYVNGFHFHCLRYKEDVANLIKSCACDRKKFTELLQELVKLATPTAPKRDSAGVLALTAEPII